VLMIPTSFIRCCLHCFELLSTVALLPIERASSSPANAHIGEIVKQPKYVQ
jgi:hypothetical protein